jgi:hypothetical protein
MANEDTCQGGYIMPEEVLYAAVAKCEAHGLARDECTIDNIVEHVSAYDAKVCSTHSECIRAPSHPSCRAAHALRVVPVGGGIAV